MAGIFYGLIVLGSLLWLWGIAEAVTIDGVKIADIIRKRVSGGK